MNTQEQKFKYISQTKTNFDVSAYDVMRDKGITDKNIRDHQT